MSDQWYYTHAEAIYGPVSAEELRRLVVTGNLLPADLVWPAGFDPTAAAPAEAALQFPTPASTEPAVADPLPESLPEWLPELAAALAAVDDLATLPTPLPESWLSDVRRAEEPPPPSEE